MKNLLTCLFALCAWCCYAQSPYYVCGGDLSLVPAYEAAGDQWLDANGKVINTTYSDGMLTYVKEVAGWNAVRVRLFVDPTRDDDPATSQDLAYVKAFGARIKAAGLRFLLDIHYSDTWADPSNQTIPSSWKFTTSTTDDVVAQKVYDYTTDVLQKLKAANATPDYVQVGNETSYGMLWRSKSKDFCNQSYSAAPWQYYARLVTQGSKAVREQCPDAKIIIHIERSGSANEAKTVYTNLRTAGLKDDAYDIIGLSYYPFWHGTLSQLTTTISALSTAFADKEVQIVETAWPFQYYPSDAKYAQSKFPWAVSAAGQGAFVKDLVAALKNCANVTGIYYWQPEECGNGSDGTTNRVMGGWNSRGFWELSWKSGQHKLIAKEALMGIQDFIPETQHLECIPNASRSLAEPPYCTLGGTFTTSLPAGQIGIVGDRKVVNVR